MKDLDLQYWKAEAQTATSALKSLQERTCAYGPVKDKSIMHAETLLESECGHMFVPQFTMRFCPFCGGKLHIGRVELEPGPEDLIA